MKILSLNVWGGMLHAPLLDYLAEADADIYCLQEVPRAVAARSQWLTYRDGAVELQQRANLYREIADVLPGHDGFFAPTARGELADGDVPCHQEFGLATFIRQDIAVIGQALDFVHGSFSPHGFGTHPRARNAHAFRLYDYEADRAVCVVQFHGLRELDGKGDTPNRTAQAEALIALIDRLHREDEGLIVCGDFNVLPDSSTFKALDRLGLTDLVTARGFSDTRTSLYTKPGRYADYMLVNDAVRIVDFTVVETPEVSDHRPLLLTIA
ncbi:endonuclease/exonuclease/phosphatase family protein [Shinella sp. CPCC 101442]|uniref:endonuclease/exonuclease/phosphatase family protein n=1 Tax=Shinella sp. CPCC 101442 TaxID=2932265 RepID=UPI00215312C2|nr:endonuclease/exonuclease/phosphatase family protein [Shinella sp. CPCC 101442]MCR6499494.1 endonuclease/exonuclease/phosphatase family protein [Shinella sp. CPCC 101442]